MNEQQPVLDRKAALIERCAQQRVETLQLALALGQHISNSSGAYRLARLAPRVAGLLRWSRDNHGTIAAVLTAALLPALLLRRRLAMGLVGRLFTMMSPMLVSRLIKRFAPASVDRHDSGDQGAPMPSPRD